MNDFKRLGWISVVFFALFLMVSLPQAMSADATGNAPVMVAPQETTIPLTVTNQGEDCPYKLRIKAGALFLHRQDNDSRELVGLDGGRTIDADDLDLGFAAGMDISLMGQYNEFGAELRYFGLHDWSESKSDSGSTSAFMRYKDLAFLYLFIDGLNINADYSSKIHNAEFNLHWWPCANDRYHLLMGVRWIRLNERLDITLADPGDLFQDRHKITADNRLWGGQIGVEGTLFGKRDQGFSVDGFLKAGYYNNNLASRMHDSNNSFSASVSKNHGTFVGELGVGAQYAFTRNIALGARYQLLWLDSIALATDQMRELKPWAGGGSVDWESLLYQGVWVGLTISF